MMKKNNKILILSAILSFIVFLLISPLRGGYILIFDLTGQQMSSSIGYILYFVLTFCLLSKYGNRVRPVRLFIAILVGASLVQLPLSIILHKTTVGTRLDYIIHLLGILLGYLVYKVNGKNKTIIVATLGIACGMWLSIRGYDLWTHKLAFGTYTGILNSKVNYDFSFQNNNGDTLQLSRFKDKIVVIDYWNTYCGVCYRKFPALQLLYDNYKDNTAVEIFAMHCRINRNSTNEDVKTGNNILIKEGYTFPCFSIGYKDSILKKLGVVSYPTVLVFNGESDLIYRGDIEGVHLLLEKLLK